MNSFLRDRDFVGNRNDPRLLSRIKSYWKFRHVHAPPLIVQPIIASRSGSNNEAY